MEILYIRVFKTYYEPALAFENMDINLNGEYYFSWDDKNSKIVYQENKNYCKELYGENLRINILIGANGTGKSTFFKFFRFLTAKLHGFETMHSYQKDHWQWIAVVDDKGLKIITPQIREKYFRNFGYDLILKSEEFNVPEFKDKKRKQNLSTCIHFSPFLEMETNPFPDAHFINVTSDGLLYTDTHAERTNDDEQILNFRKSEVKRQIDFVKYSSTQVDRNINFFRPFLRDTIYVKSDAFTQTLEDKMRYVEFGSMSVYTILEKQFVRRYHDLHHQIHGKSEQDKEFSNEKSEILKLIFYRKLVEALYRNAEYRGDPKRTKKHAFLIQIQNLSPQKYSELNDDALKSFKAFFEHLDEDYIDVDGKEKILDAITDFDQLVDNQRLHLVRDESIQTNLEGAKALLEIEARIHKALPFDSKLILFTFDWGNMSTGERAYLNLFARLHYAGNLLEAHQDLSDAKLLYFLIDEPATGFHPQWQKEYLTKLLTFLSLRFVQEKHLIISTHSPFILSEVQMPDVIVLNDGEIQSLKAENTFGANIHELLADNFFLQDGFMGDFAKSKILDLLKFLKYNAEEEESDKNEKPLEKWDENSAQSAIGIIGEPLIKERLQSLFDKKYLIKEKEKLESRIKALQKQLKELE